MQASDPGSLNGSQGHRNRRRRERSEALKKKKLTGVLTDLGKGVRERKESVRGAQVRLGNGVHGLKRAQKGGLGAWLAGPVAMRVLSWSAMAGAT